jgi:serine protease
MVSASRHRHHKQLAYSGAMTSHAPAALLALLTSMATVFPLAALAAPPAGGFIVELRELATADVGQKRIQSVVTGQALPLAVQRPISGRWHRLVSTEGALDAAASDALAARLRADPRVRSVVPDVREQRQAVTPNDSRYASQWWLQAVGGGNTGAAGFAKAWERSTGVANGSVVAVLDSGITSHIETNARVLPGYDFVADAVYAGDGNGRDNDAQDPGDAITAADRLAQPDKFSGCPDAPRASWHGSTIAGQLAAVTNNTEGVAAANWQGLVLPVRVAGKCGAAVSDLIDGLRWAAGLAVTGVPDNTHPARLIVLSYGGADPCDAASADATVRDTARLYETTLAEVRAAGALVIVAAGNQQRGVGRPASCRGAFAVTSVNRDGYKAAYANFGPSIALATPGGDDASGGSCASGAASLRDGGIVSTGNLGEVSPGAAGYVAASGTSFAAPAVAAVASLMLAVNPTLSLAQLEQGLRASARPHVLVPLLGHCAVGSNASRCACTTATCGAGLLDADQALLFAAAPSAYTAPAPAPVTLADDRLRACAQATGRAIDAVPPAPPETPAAAVPTTPAVEPVAAGGSGGGALSSGWLLGLAIAVALLAIGRRVRDQTAPH